MVEGNESQFIRELEKKGTERGQNAFAHKEKLMKSPVRDTLTVPLGAATEIVDHSEGKKIRFQGEVFMSGSGSLRSFDLENVFQGILAAEMGLDQKQSAFPFFKTPYEKKAGNGIIVLNMDIRDIVSLLDTCSSAIGGIQVGEAAVREYERLCKTAVSTIPMVRAKAKKHGVGPSAGEKTMRDQSTHTADAIEFLAFLMKQKL